MLFLNLVLFVILCLLINNFDCYGVVNLGLGGSLCKFFDLSLEISSHNVYLLLMLTICSNLSLVYSFHYFGGYNDNSVSLARLLLLFILVMFSLVVSCDLLSSLIFWEYLGLTSYLLICFYDTSSSLRGGLVTLVSSRFGDVAFFLILSMVYLGGGFGLFFFFLVCVVVFTKSACFPFGSWLLEAMRAPTPVSSLVHSSTLVASGVWFWVCYGDVSCSDSFCVPMLGVCLFTILLSGWCALYNCDVKQVVALSTCNNVAWVLVVCLQGDVSLGVLQLLVHAISKCLLFIYVGDYISSSSGSQHVSQLNVGYYSNFSLVYILVLLAGLSGLPFLGLYFSKHLFLVTVSSYNFVNLFFVLFVSLGLVLSCSYCVRLFLCFFCRELFVVSGSRVSFVGNLVVLFVIGYSSLGFFFNVEVCQLGYVYTLLLFGSLVIGYVLSKGYYCVGGVWTSVLWGQDVLVQVYELIILGASRFAVLSLLRWESLVLGYLWSLVGNGVWLGFYYSVNCMFVGVIMMFIFYLF